MHLPTKLGRSELAGIDLKATSSRGKKGGWPRGYAFECLTTQVGMNGDWHWQRKEGGQGG